MSIERRDAGGSRRRVRQSGFVMLVVTFALILIAAIGLMLMTGTAMEADQTDRAAETRAADFLAQAALEHALWRNNMNVCAGDFTIPVSSFGTHSYSAAATASGGGTATSYSLAVDQDAWIDNKKPDTNAGADTKLRILSTSGDLQQPVLRFDLSSLPPDARILSATAYFYVTKEHAQGPLTMHRITEAWTEADVTWNSISGAVESHVLTTIAAQADQDVWVPVNLTAEVQAWVNGVPNHGVLLAAGVADIHADYASREGVASQRPRLDVVVGTAPAVPMSITATATLDSGVSRIRNRPVTPAPQPAVTASLQLGTDSGEDTLLDSFYDIRNYGGANYLAIEDNGSNWQQYPLIRFDLDSLPIGATVLSARLELRLWSVNSPGTATVHRVRRSWVEGTRNGGGVADGATWWTYDGTNAWLTAGGDHDVARVAATDIDGSETWVSWEIAPLVERWLAGEPNYGILIEPENGLKLAQFASQEYFDQTARPKLTITYACECGTACMAPRGAGNVLMVVVNPTTLVPADATKKALFESWGYTVNVISESANAATYAAEANDNDVVFISETVNSNQVGTRLADLSIGVVSQDGDYNSDLGFAGSSSWPVSPAISITDASHYITLIFPAGPLDIYSAGMEQLTVSGGTAAGLQTLATTSGAGSLVVLDAGAMTNGGSPAAGRRVMLPLGRGAGFNWDYLNNSGRLMTQRALAWASGLLDSPGGLNVLLVVVNPANLTSQEQAKKGLIESWGHTVNLIDESDSQTNFDLAIAANDVAYVPQDITSGNLGTKLRNASIGVVNEEGEQVDELGFAGDRIFKSRDEIDVIDTTHYITELFSPGLVTFSSSLQSVHMLSGGVAPGLSELGRSFNTGSLWEPSLGVIDTGDALWGGGTAAGRRVELPWGGGTFDINLLTNEGRVIMQRALEWGGGLGSLPAGPGLLFVSGGSVVMGPSMEVMVVPTAAEQERIDLIESWGYAVTLIHESASSESIGTAIPANDVAYISGDVSDLTLSEKMKDAPIGIVNEQIALHDELGFSSSSATNEYNRISVVDISHSITTGFSIGWLDVTTVDQPLNALTGTLAAGLENLAEVWITGANYDDGLAVLETGAELYGGGSAAGRRAQLPWGVTGFDFTTLNANGQAIMQRAIEWAASGETGAGGGGATGYIELNQPWSANSSTEWETVSLAGYGVPADAVVEVAVINERTSAELSGGVRAVGSSLNRRLPLHEAEGGGADAVVMHVQTNGASEIQHYSENKNSVSFVLLGYWIGATYVERFEPFSAGANAVWRAHDLAAYGVGSNQVAEIAIANTSTSIEWLVGARQAGSGQQRRIVLHEAEGSGVDMVSMQVAADASSRIEVYAQADSVVDFHLLGYWDTPPGTYTETGGVHAQASSGSTWEVADLSIFGIPADSVAQFMISNEIDNFDRDLGVRQVGSAQHRVIRLHEAEAGGADVASLHVNVDSGSQIEWYSGDGTSERFFYPLGWWVLP